ncbi:SH3-like domain-containing protein [Lentibacillus persicus]|uniref:Autolysin n=1 Tax=Lentibacillus persicus TaxID=640948 RepID=A0A1I1VTI9_9BACI|nr:S-layer homology domain-containing protein [Lentibacillus persicus]SFD86231.1 SH3-like domain-containing protein [Lentibacillus persicus]
MRRSVIIAFIAVLSFLSVPLQFSAHESGSDDHSEEPNKQEIEEGTEVHGIDISELTEEELKYVPESWRDGKIEEDETEHPEAEEHYDPEEDNEKEERNISLQESSYINNYILNNGLSAAQTEYNHLHHLPKFGYRFTGPEGIVAHETANDYSTIDGEISYMSRNYQNAFVHAFVDHERVIEVHPTNYAAWGAGPVANERFIHVELVRVDNKNQFIRSINNYATYIAGLLYKYNLGYDNAEWDGEGTLWSHEAVSRYLGGTNHVDPHGYFERYGYDWAAFARLVYAKLNDMGMQTENTSKLGKIKSEEDPIYGDPEDNQNYKKAGETYSDHVYFIKQQGKLRGQTYYLISDHHKRGEGVIGWVNSRDINVKSHTGIDSKDKIKAVKGSGSAYSLAWGGEKDKVYPDLSTMEGEKFEVDLTEEVGSTTWYRGMLNGKRVWIQERHVEQFANTMFNDVPPGSSHFDTIYELVDMGVINGYPTEDGAEFRPGESLSRSHAAVIFTNTLDLPIPDDVDGVLRNFDDIDGSHMYADQIAATYKAGIFRGSNGKFMDQPLTREQMATVIAEAFDLEDAEGYTDIKLSSVSPDHKRNVQLLAHHGITSVPENFRSYENVTRGQFATFVFKAMKN